MNSHEHADIVARVAGEVVGGENVSTRRARRPEPGFRGHVQAKPGAYFWLGHKGTTLSITPTSYLTTTSFRSARASSRGLSKHDCRFRQPLAWLDYPPAERSQSKCMSPLSRHARDRKQPENRKSPGGSMQRPCRSLTNRAGFLHEGSRNGFSLIREAAMGRGLGSRKQECGMRLSMTRLGLITATAFLTLRRPVRRLSRSSRSTSRRSSSTRSTTARSRRRTRRARSSSFSTPTMSRRRRTARSRIISPRKSTASCSSPLM